MVVVDASVVVKWFVPETDTDKALSLRDAHINGVVRIATVDLCLVELANALRFRKPAPTAEQISGAVRSFVALDARVVATTPDLLDIATRIALSQGLTIYDALYAALAVELGYELVTADDGLLQKAPPEARACHLSAWQPPVKKR